MRTEYLAILRRIRAVKAAPHGQKKARQRDLVKARVGSLKREIRKQASAAVSRGTLL